MSAHTPGPWVVHTMRPHTLGMESIDGPGFNHIAECHNIVGIGDCGPCLRVDTDVIEANARLIAAAPDLLEALEMVRDADDDCKRDGLVTIPDPARAKIDAAIARATQP